MNTTNDKTKFISEVDKAIVLICTKVDEEFFSSVPYDTVEIINIPIKGISNNNISSIL